MLARNHLPPSERLRRLAHSLADMKLGGAGPEARCLLRDVSLDLLELSELAAEAEERARPRTRRERIGVRSLMRRGADSMVSA